MLYDFIVRAFAETVISACLNPYSNGICSMIVKIKFRLFIIIHITQQQKLFTNYHKKASFLKDCKGTTFYQNVKERFR